jgi:membrane fusion protein, copper/silver efflux system
MKKSPYFILLFLVLMALSFLAGRHFNGSKIAGVPSARRVLYWVDPMHPAYKSDKPGIAPDCGMQLEPVYADGGPSDMARGIDVSTPGSVQISLEQQQLIGLRTASVETTSGTRNVRLSGRVATDEERTYRVVSGTDGYIDKTFHDTTGSLVKKGDVLATSAASDFVTAQQAYLASVQRSPESFREVHSQVDWRSQTTQLALGNLRALGMSDAQIKSITEKGKVADTVNIVSPVDGFILARNISPGQRFEKGAEFYRIADLRHVWILADVFENEASYFRPGTVATVTAPQLGKSFRARVDDSLPQFDPATRTLKIRLETDNPDFSLRPDMFVDIELPTRVPPGLSVPVDAVLDSGLTKRVFVDRGNGFFEPREVETGWRTGDRIQVVRGLKAGDLVVVSGTFLLDSESRLKATAAGNSAPKMDMTEKKDSGRVITEQKGHAAMAMTKSAMAPAHSVKDPRCGMDVDPKEATAAGNTASYRGSTYYFCSKSCKSAFEKEPERYLAASHQGSHND